MDIEDSYVVRIYRRTPASPKDGVGDDRPYLIGVVEDPGTGKRRAFHNIEELWAVLAETGPRYRGANENRPPPKHDR